MFKESEILDWDNSSDEACRKIQSRYSDFKIITKTKNEKHLLLSWIQHHSKIVGLCNLIIFDNCSTDVEVCSLLEEVATEATVVRFSGFHNKIHRTADFAKLYASVICSSKYYCLIDSDEKLVWVENATKVANTSEIVERLNSASFGVPRVLPGLWVENLWLSESKFKLYEGKVPWPNGLRTGKPILMATANLPAVIGHNFQLDLESPEDISCGQLMVLHLKNLYPEQRLKTNINKLRQYGIIKEAMSDEDAIPHVLGILESDIQSNNARKWIREIRALRESEKFNHIGSTLRAGEIELMPDGEMVHATDAQRLDFEEYLFDPGWFFSLTLPGGDGYAIKKPKSMSISSAGSNFESNGITEMNKIEINNTNETDPVQSEVNVRELPSMSDGGLARFRVLLSQTSCYLEYGSGGSTRLAVRYNVPRIYSVESDPVFAKAVRRAVSWDIKASYFKMVVPELGATGPYGYPTDPNFSGNWWKYPTQVWESITADQAAPDLMLIDGRFRVFCFLVCLLNSKPGALILFDDYSNRMDRYGEVEKVLKPIALHDRMAEFKVPEILDFKLISKLIAKYSCDRR